MKYFSLNDYNEALQNFDYEYTESDKPPLITKHSFSKLRLTVSQSLLLARILPFLVGGKVLEDENWRLFLILLTS